MAMRGRRTFTRTAPKAPVHWTRNTIQLNQLTTAAPDQATALFNLADLTFQGTGGVVGMDIHYTLRRLFIQLVFSVVTLVAKQLIRIIWGVTVKDQGDVAVVGLATAASQREDWLTLRQVQMVGTAAGSPQLIGETNNVDEEMLKADVKSSRILGADQQIQLSWALRPVAPGAVGAGTTVDGNVIVSALWSQTRR